MAIEPRGFMDNVKELQNGGASFGLRLSKKEDTGEWRNAWMSVYVPANATGRDLVTPENAKSKVKLLDGFFALDTYRDDAVEIKFICSELILDQQARSAPHVPTDEVPF